MLLRSGKSISFPGSHHSWSCRGSGGSTCGSAGRLRRRKKSSGEASTCASDEVADRLRLLKRKSFGEEEAASPHQVKTVAISVSSSKHPSPEPGVFPPDDSNNVYNSFNETSIAELGVEVFPDVPQNVADATWLCFLDNSKACLKYYNTKYQADFMYKHVMDFGLILVGEEDGKYYHHINFYAQDKKGHSQLFFGEIRVRVEPKEDDVSCCHPVSRSDAGGKSIRTIEDLIKHKFPAWGTAGVDRDHCYACPSAIRHPKGTCYVAGHVADSRQYYVPG